jgi:hypothetical protein
MNNMYRYSKHVIVLFIAGTLLYLAIPRFAAAIATLPSGPILAEIQENKPVSLTVLSILIKSQQRGLSWHQSARGWTDLGLAQVLAAQKTQDTKVRSKLLRDAQDSLVNGLSLGPSNAYAWARLAYVDLAINGLSPSVTQKISLSISRGPYDRRLVFPRLQLYFLAWSTFDKSTQQIVLDQVLYAWSIDPTETVALATKFERIGIVYAALIAHPSEFEKFENIQQALSRKKQ